VVWLRGNRLSKLFIPKTTNTITNTTPQLVPLVQSSKSKPTMYKKGVQHHHPHLCPIRYVSSRVLTVLVTHPYDDQRYREVDPIEGEYIYDVERLDDRWCRGTTADGKWGLFPAGYVVESVIPNEAEVPPLRETSTEEQNSDHACFTDP